jgi:hypothetical protein
MRSWPQTLGPYLDNLATRATSILGYFLLAWPSRRFQLEMLVVSSRTIQSLVLDRLRVRMGGPIVIGPKGNTSLQWSTCHELQRQALGESRRILRRKRVGWQAPPQNHHRLPTQEVGLLQQRKMGTPMGPSYYASRRG